MFFKPVSGFGSRGAYRGEKLTKRVWADILASQYVAQAMVRPSRTFAAPALRGVDQSTKRYHVTRRQAFSVGGLVCPPWTQESPPRWPGNGKAG